MKCEGVKGTEARPLSMQTLVWLKQGHTLLIKHCLTHVAFGDLLVIY